MSTITITDPTAGKPRQVIPLRMVPAITGFTPRDVVAWLAEVPIVEVGPILTAHEYRAKSRLHRPVRRELYVHLMKDMEKASNYVKELELIPTSHFVYSDDLAAAFTAFIDIFIDREVARESGMHLDWDPALGQYEHLVEACSGVFAINEEQLDGHTKRRLKTLQSDHDLERLVRDEMRRNGSNRLKACNTVAAAEAKQGRPISAATLYRRMSPRFSPRT